MSLPQLTLTILTVPVLSASRLLFKIAAGNFAFSATGFIGSPFNMKLIIALIGCFSAAIMRLFMPGCSRLPANVHRLTIFHF